MDNNKVPVAILDLENQIQLCEHKIWKYRQLLEERYKTLQTVYTVQSFDHYWKTVGCFVTQARAEAALAGKQNAMYRIQSLPTSEVSDSVLFMMDKSL